MKNGSHDTLVSIPLFIRKQWLLAQQIIYLSIFEIEQIHVVAPPTNS